jgi:hypothetical protein
MIEKIKKLFKKPEKPFKEMKFKINLNRVSRKVFVKETGISFCLCSAEEFDSFTTILLNAQKNQLIGYFSIGQKDGKQVVTIVLPKEKLLEMKNDQPVREFFTTIKIPVRGFVHHNNSF